MENKLQLLTTDRYKIKKTTSEVTSYLKRNKQKLPGS